MKNVYSLLILVVIFGFPACFIWNHGGTWEFGPHGIPVSVLSSDGTMYRNGSEIDPITAAIIRSGKEEQLLGCTLGVVSALLACLAFKVRGEKHVLKIRAKHKESEGLLAIAKRYQQMGRQEEAKRNFASYWQSVEAEMALWLSRRSTRRMIEEARRANGRTG